MRERSGSGMTSAKTYVLSSTVCREQRVRGNGVREVAGRAGLAHRLVGVGGACVWDGSG